MRGFGWILIIVLGAGAVAALDQDRGFRTWFRLQRELRSAEQRIADIARDIETQRDQVAALQNDPFSIERAIREELRYARTGETVVRLQPGRLATPRDD